MGTQVICPRVVSGCRFVGARGALELHLTRECEYASAGDQLVPAGTRESGAVDAPSESLESDIPDSAADAIRNASNQSQSAFQQPSTGLRRSASQHKHCAGGGGAKSSALSAELARKELSLSPRRAPSRAADGERELLDGALQPVYPAARPGTAFAPIQQHQLQQHQLQQYQLQQHQLQQHQVLGGRAQVCSPRAFATRSVRLVQQQQQQAFAMHDNANGSCLAPMAQCVGGGVSFASSALEASQVFTSATATVPKYTIFFKNFHISFIIYLRPPPQVISVAPQ